MIIRHGEKPPESGQPYGITSNGTRDPNALTPFGWARAGALVELFAPFGGSVPAGLMRPQAMFACRPEDGQNLRESQTASLLARRLGVPVEMPYVVGQEAELAATLSSRSGPILVVWNHTRIPDIPQHLGTVRPGVPPTWPDERFDMVYVLPGIGPGTYAFTQVPQLLLPGDDPAPIA
jgi:hypothetical protein